MRKIINSCKYLQQIELAIHDTKIAFRLKDHLKNSFKVKANVAYNKIIQDIKD